MPPSFLTQDPQQPARKGHSKSRQPKSEQKSSLKIPPKDRRKDKPTEKEDDRENVAKAGPAGCKQNPNQAKCRGLKGTLSSREKAATKEKQELRKVWYYLQNAYYQTCCFCCFCFLYEQAEFKCASLAKLKNVHMSLAKIEKESANGMKEMRFNIS